MSKEIKELLLKESENYRDRLINLVSKLTQFNSYIGDEKEIAHAQFVVAREETSKAIDKAFKGMKSVVARRFK